MEKGSCCPNGSWPRLQSNYQSKGQVIDIDGTKCYHVGQGNKVIILVSDIFGATSGKHEAVADTFSALGYNVYLPQILETPYAEEMDMPKIVANIKSQNYELMSGRFQKLNKYIQSKGHKNSILIGFCWGVWFAFKMAVQYNSILSIVGMHPSLGVQQMFGGDVNQLTKKIKCPALLLPAGNDPQNIKPNGQVIQILQEKFGKEKVGSIQFKEMVHGWTVRGDVSDQKVKRDVQLSIQQAHNYISKFEF